MALRPPIRVGFVLHSMGVAGAEVLVAELLDRAEADLEPTIFCLDEVGALGEQLQAQGVEVIALGRRPGVDLTLVGRLGREIASRGIELVHAHQYTPFFYAALAKMAKIRRASRFRLILTEHGRHYPDVVSTNRRWANRLVFARQADAITGCSDFSRRGLADNDGFPLERIELIPNGVDIGRYRSDRDRARDELGLPAGRTLVLCVARLHPVKDHRTLIAGFARLARTRADVDLLLAGDGPERSALEALVGELGLEQRVHFLGVRNDVAKLLAAADLFAMTSLSEAASLTVLEAMASELAVVVTEVGGNPEMVRDGIEGRLVPRGDERAVAEALAEMVINPAAAGAMGRAGRERVKALYTLEQTVAAYLDLFARVSGRSG